MKAHIININIHLKEFDYEIIKQVKKKKQQKIDDGSATEASRLNEKVGKAVNAV